MKKITMATLLCVLVGCAQGRLDIMNTDGKVVGHCSASFDWHWYGAEDSVNYIINLCAQEYIAKGYKTSDASFLAHDYILPIPLRNSVWNRKTAKEQFSAGMISEQKYGYVLAAIEYKYLLKIEQADKRLAQKKITSTEYKRMVREAKIEFNGI